MGRSLSTIVAALLLAATGPPFASAHEVMPRSAGAFQNSVGVTTHIVYYDTSYGDWGRIVTALEDLGVKHLRDGMYANPSPQWHDWNQRYYDAVALAAARGIKFDFGMGEPGFQAGTLDQLVATVSGRLRGAVDAFEDPNEFDLFGGMAHWPGPLAAYDRQLYERIKSYPSLRSLPVIGPSFAGAAAPEQLGNQHRWLDIGNIHPYTGGQSPSLPHTESELRRAAVTAGRKPVWATEAGFNNAVHAPVSSSEQPPVPEGVAALYTVRTLLDDFKSGIGRTYLYELIDEHPDPARTQPQQDYGLLRSDFSPKPAYLAVRNLLRLVGQGAPRTGLRPLRLNLTGDSGRLRQLVVQRSDGTYVVALWSLASAWNTSSRRALSVRAHRVTVSLPSGSRAALADPVVQASARPVRVRAGTVHLAVGRDPVVLLVDPHGR